MGWKEAAAAKRRQIWAQAPSDWQGATAGASPAGQVDGQAIHHMVQEATSAAQQQITQCSGLELLQTLANGDVTAVEALTAFMRRAMLAHAYASTRCLCENNWPAALARARDLDTHFRAYGSTVGPLHGLTVSLMDRYHVAGLNTACGFVSWLDAEHTAQDEGTLVRMLRHLGAVVHCKTNVPMSLMLGETANNIIGTTVNPYNVSLSAGGACGGEGALLSLRGSSIGFGTETAGSSRIPAAFCGLWALKCSENRLPQDGIATVLPGLAEGALGMLSNDRSTLIHVLKTILNSTLTTTDPDLLPLPWRQDLFDSILRRKHTPGASNGRLVFGILLDDSHIRPQPPIRRAVNLVADTLRHRGHEIVPWRPPPHLPAVETLFQILGSTAASEARAALKASGEPPIPQLQDWYQHQDIAPSDSAEFWALCARRQAYRKEYKAYWNSVGAGTESGRVPDGVIMPVAATLAVRPGEFRYYGYSAIVNALDYVAGVFPVMTADRDVDSPAEELAPLGELDREVQSSYNPEDAHGMPVALQVMVPRLREEVAAGLLEVISECLAETEGFAAEG